MPQVDEKSCGREHPMTHLIKRVELTQIMNNSEILQSGSFIDTPRVYCLILKFYRIFILHSNYTMVVTYVINLSSGHQIVYLHVCAH